MARGLAEFLSREFTVVVFVEAIKPLGTARKFIRRQESVTVGIVLFEDPSGPGRPALVIAGTGASLWSACSIASSMAFRAARSSMFAGAHPFVRPIPMHIRTPKGARPAHRLSLFHSGCVTATTPVVTRARQWGRAVETRGRMLA